MKVAKKQPKVLATEMLEDHQSLAGEGATDFDNIPGAILVSPVGFRNT